ncbi:MAG: hypothetical protein HY369_03735 [Candidatus Aenigmarchaeota archaeon]|nr:hypothetical protein [Candidatus Aenigmarchaeota archaeon]
MKGTFHRYLRSLVEAGDKQPHRSLFSYYVELHFHDPLCKQMWGNFSVEELQEYDGARAKVVTRARKATKEAAGMVALTEVGWQGTLRVPGITPPYLEVASSLAGQRPDDLPPTAPERIDLPLEKAATGWRYPLDMGLDTERPLSIDCDLVE